LYSWIGLKGELMNVQQATELIKKFSEPYLFPFAKELPEMEAARWIRLLVSMKLSSKKAGEILTEFISKNPPRIKPDGSPVATMPDIRDLKEFIKNYHSPSHKDCPMCHGEGFVQRSDGMLPCDGKTAPIEIEIDKSDPAYLKGLKILGDIEKTRGKSSNIVEKLTKEIRNIPKPDKELPADRVPF
jgi:hypothetical protein